ncbi:MAG: hypothetical protein DMF61_14680 [Blastocatellia bacterium AA13]|nr:MAG: hypothetical protein DMF61_14680 [Blastocatellia bacterium AA13]
MQYGLVSRSYDHMRPVLEVIMELNHRWIRAGALVGLVILAASAALAQESRPRQVETGAVKEPAGTSPDKAAPSKSTLYSQDEDYRIGAKDVIDIQVDDAESLSGSYTVRADGTLDLDYIGKIKVLDKTPAELQKLIVDKLKPNYLKNPRVRILVKNYNSRTFLIQGSVRTPGVYQIEGQPSLFKLIVMAGGLTDNHGSTAYIIREHRHEAGADQSAPTYEMFAAHINGLLKGEFSQDRDIRPGDFINIPATDVFFISGEVRTPGEYKLKEGATLRQALSIAQGVTSVASDEGIVFREDPKTGARTEIKVDVKKIMHGKADDMPLVANDIIQIPKSGGKAFRSSLIKAFGMSVMRAPIP